MFQLYLEHGCLNATASAAEQLGLRSKYRVFANGRTQGGIVLSRGQIYRILTNPVYRGLIRDGDRLWPALHPAIVEESLWDDVQTKLQAASARRRGASGIATGAALSQTAPLLGKFRDETGDLLTPSHTQRHGRRLRYYVSNRLVAGTADKSGWRLPAPAFEAEIASIVATHLEERAKAHRIVACLDAGEAQQIQRRVLDLVDSLRREGAAFAAPLIECGVITTSEINLALNPRALASKLGVESDQLEPKLCDFTAPFTCRKRGVEIKIVAGDPAPSPDPAMLRALRNAHHWANALKSGVPIKIIAAGSNYSESYVARLIPLATLSPRIQEAIATGTQPLPLNLETLVRSKIPLDWVDQERLFGFAR